ncbi:MAG: YraN family protein [Alkalispirochaeta sp.]
MTAPGDSSSRRGRHAEERAATYLESQGYKILQRNFRTPRGEVDIICEAPGTIVFVEVKGWSTYHFAELEHGISPKKQRRIIGAARHFMHGRNDSREISVRFDVLFLGGTDRSIEHIQGAFDSPWPG